MQKPQKEKIKIPVYELEMYRSGTKRLMAYATAAADMKRKTGNGQGV